MIWDAVASLAGKVIDIFHDSDEVKKAKIERKVAEENAKAQAALKKIEQTGTWEQIHAEGSQTSFKDEASLYTFLAIMIAVFIPSLQPYVIEGFKQLALLPDWFTEILKTMIYASFGIRAAPTAISKTVVAYQVAKKAIKDNKEG